MLFFQFDRSYCWCCFGRHLVNRGHCSVGICQGLQQMVLCRRWLQESQWCQSSPQFQIGWRRNEKTCQSGLQVYSSFRTIISHQINQFQSKLPNFARILLLYFWLQYFYFGIPWIILTHTKIFRILIFICHFRDNIDKGDDKKTVTRQSSTSSNNTSPKKASAPIQKNGDWLPDSRKSVYTATPTLAANTPLNQAPTSPASSSSSSSSASNQNQTNPATAPPRPPKDGLTYANLDHKAFMNDPRNRVLPNDSPLIPKSNNTTYASVKTREVVQTSSRTFGEYKPRSQTSNLM